MKGIHLFVILLFGLCGLPLPVSAQSRMLAPDTISTNDVFGFTLTPNGKTGFFVKAYGGRDTMVIMMTEHRNSRWQLPKLAPFSFADRRYQDIDPVVSPDGQLVLFNSNRPLPGETTTNDFNIWVSRKTRTGWSGPYVLSPVLNSDSADIYATMSRNGSVYFASRRRDGYGGLDLYRSEFKDGQYLPPINLGASINSSDSDSNPYIAPDESFLIFISRRPSGPSGLLISFRKGEHWTAPVEVELPDDPAGGAFCPFITPDGKTFYFSRTRVEGKKRIENIYQMPAGALQLETL